MILFIKKHKLIGTSIRPSKVQMLKDHLLILATTTLEFCAANAGELPKYPPKIIKGMLAASIILRPSSHSISLLKTTSSSLSLW